jgi:hypothetical protein
MTTAVLVNVLFILACHWFCDFVLQTDKQALNKSSSNIWLLAHVGVYTVSMTCLIALYSVHTLNHWSTVSNLAKFGAVTFVAHFLTDWVTSRVNSALWKADKRHEFFVSVGFDQFLHFAQLLITYRVVFG